MTDRNTIKTLLLDIELSYAIYYAFPSKKPQFLSARNIIQHQFCPIVCYKWDHQINVQSVSILDDMQAFTKDFRNDYVVAKKMHDLFEEADLICAHNGDSFDIKHINTLFIKHGLPPVSEKKSIDTLKAARKYFAFAGNGLDDLLRFFKLGEKGEKPDWLLMSAGDIAEIKKGIKYCKKDVMGLQKIFDKIKPYMRRLPMIKGIGAVSECAACRSGRLVSKGRGFNGSTMYQRIKCGDCGHEMKSKL